MNESYKVVNIEEPKNEEEFQKAKMAKKFSKDVLLLVNNAFCAGVGTALIQTPYDLCKFFGTMSLILGGIGIGLGINSVNKSYNNAIIHEKEELEEQRGKR